MIIYNENAVKIELFLTCFGTEVLKVNDHQVSLKNNFYGNETIHEFEVYGQNTTISLYPVTVSKSTHYRITKDNKYLITESLRDLYESKWCQLSGLFWVIIPIAAFLELHNAVYQYFPSPLMYMGIMAFTAFIFMCSRVLNLEINPLKNTDVANTKYLMTLVVMLSIVVVLTGGVNRFFSDGDVYYQEYPIIKHGYRYASRGVLANWFIALNIKGMRYDVILSTHDYMNLTNKKIHKSKFKKGLFYDYIL